ncbi:MAG: acylphosphatase [Spirochaetes bacterium]|nr:acylphosphatase [Spirochaetota bacterium]
MRYRNEPSMDDGPNVQKKATRLRIFGRVQGVGFRYWTSHIAERWGIVGWVRNERDGSVTVECEGPEELVDRFIQLVRQGPPGSRVDHVEITPLAPKGTYRRFSIEF